MGNVITIDGPSSSGKTSVGFLFSKKISYKFIDSGAIYRAGCLKILQEDPGAVGQEDKAASIFESLGLDFKTTESSTRALLDGEDVTDILHNPEITAVVPKVAAYPKVRKIAKKLQRDIASNNDIVIAGRDVGSEIFPDAKLKFFITASAKVRAQRRFEQLKKKVPAITFEEVLKSMIDRDKQDSERETSPMRIPEGAVIIDTSNLSSEESVQQLMNEFRKKI